MNIVELLYKPSAGKVGVVRHDVILDNDVTRREILAQLLRPEVVEVGITKKGIYVVHVRGFNPVGVTEETLDVMEVV